MAVAVTSRPDPTVDVYSNRADGFFRQYESIRFEDVHGHWGHCIPPDKGLALDVGAGSGRDARALAGLGWHVIAVEPAEGLRRLGESAKHDDNVQWVDSALPDLDGISPDAGVFGLILLSAVWMHLPPAMRPRAMHRLASLLSPSGILVITLRHGPAPDDRTFHPCDRQELEDLAHEYGLSTQFEDNAGDQLGRSDVRWETVVLAKT